MDQTNSIFMPGLTRRGPVYNASYSFAGLPAVSPVMKYGIMAALLYLGAKKKLPFGLYGGAAAAFAVYQFFPDASSVTPASGAPSASDIASLTAGSSTVQTPDISPPMPNVGFPSGSISGLGMYES